MKEGYKPTEIGVIPEDWEVQPLNEIAPLQRGFDLPYSQKTTTYNDLVNGISATTVYLERFFENLLMGYHNELKNRYIHVEYKEQRAIQSATGNAPKCNNCTLEELAILRELQRNPSVTQKELAKIIGKSERTIKTRTVKMQEKGFIKRENGKRNGRWEVLIKL